MSSEADAGTGIDVAHTWSGVIEFHFRNQAQNTAYVILYLRVSYQHYHSPFFFQSCASFLE
jgi:hypothetical protein